MAKHGKKYNENAKLVDRNKLYEVDEAFALKKIEAQMSDADRLAYGPKPIDNNGTLAALYRQVDELLAAEKPYDKS